LVSLAASFLREKEGDEGRDEYGEDLRGKPDTSLNFNSIK